MTDTLDRIRELAATRSCEAALVGYAPDVAWATGFTGSTGLLVVAPDAAHLVTDGRYRTQAAEETSGVELHFTADPPVQYAGRHELLGSARRVVVQSDHVTLEASGRLERAFPDVTFLPEAEWLAPLVAAKTEEEIGRIGRAQALTCEVFRSILPLVRPGATEREIAAELVVRHLRAGCSAMSFEPIVAGGPRGALPHARPTDRPFETGDLVVLDVGGVLDGMCADLTRTVAVGEPGDRARAAYAAVGRAHAAGIAALRAGVAGSEADRAARDVLAEAGLAEAFDHSLGHGVGRDVHEWPRLSQAVEHTIPAGATVTVEPGVYLPGRFGIRTEDLVVVREGGAESLTPLSAELVVL